MKPLDGSLGVVEDLNFCSRPVSSITRQSVKVPPTSTQTRLVFPDIGNSSSLPPLPRGTAASDITRPRGCRYLIRLRTNCKAVAPGAAHLLAHVLGLAFA